MAWYDEISDDFKTVSSSIPNELVDDMDRFKGTLTRSRLIRNLVESWVEEQKSIREESAA